MPNILKVLRGLLRRPSRHVRGNSQSAEQFQGSESPEPADGDYPTFPPPSPQDILDHREGYWESIRARKYAAPRGIFEDNSLYALYRLYEVIVLDQVFAYRSMLEWFWRQHQWPICDIPDPQDSDPARYAFRASVTYLIVRSFNARVALGLTRDAPAIMSMEEVEEERNRPDDERPYECVPAWTEAVSPLSDTLCIPTHDGVVLNGKGDKRADEDFLEKNILLWTPHIYFT